MEALPNQRVCSNVTFLSLLPKKLPVMSLQSLETLLHPPQERPRNSSGGTTMSHRKMEALRTHTQAPGLTLLLGREQTREHVALRPAPTNHMKPSLAEVGEKHSSTWQTKEHTRATRREGRTELEEATTSWGLKLGGSDPYQSLPAHEGWTSCPSFGGHLMPSQ